MIVYVYIMDGGCIPYIPTYLHWTSLLPNIRLHVQSPLLLLLLLIIYHAAATSAFVFQYK